jgi:hypothetical protein
MKFAVCVTLFFVQRKCRNLTVTKMVKSLVVWIIRKMEFSLLLRKQ